MSAFLLRFRLITSKKRVATLISFVDSNSSCKDLLFPHDANLALKLPYLVRVRFFVNGVALVELLNSLDSRSSKLAMDAYFIFMVRTTTRKAETRRF